MRCLKIVVKGLRELKQKEMLSFSFLSQPDDLSCYMSKSKNRCIITSHENLSASLYDFGHLSIWYFYCKSFATNVNFKRSMIFRDFRIIFTGNFRITFSVLQSSTNFLCHWENRHIELLHRIFIKQVNLFANTFFGSLLETKNHFLSDICRMKMRKRFTSDLS